MIVGICLIIAGLLIAFYPPLLSIIVAVLLIFIGSMLTLISYRFKKMNKHFSDPFADFFLRF
jgi:Flp pilus assembly protein TadB